ncbi:anion transporter [Staphylococcus succinus]|uniref:Sodium-dependent dicarboxylate transporter SdcS n=1 Tax=Staphylococcus succinus TaxID=61015 RepID=A0ABX5IMB4_9STAP|nr:MULTISPECIES: DASS family sodium-coupled anion symporter [Staphylococcus]MDH9160735.1 DASS family sodium-coupled anion symporter [Staphylococcus succinus]MEB7462708.1 DASS family sodium-coupled anion symporter [Staphylococcus succinus]OIJ31147.1 anion transporter [Staphylococcus sp. LCT-H4]PKI21531.1 anion transporter [Staphylococcus succinus]PNZ23498.1 anion transporter [Staphylococcus succinus subsp. succinus]
MKKKIGLILGPLFFIIIYFIPGITGLDDAPRAVLAVTVFVATWWITEAIPIPATSLIPLVLLPLTGGTDEKVASSAYADPIVFMYMGGFIIALAIEKWSLHKRIAMTIISMMGSNSNRIILGTMIATSFISMWISNAATALMMLPIALALIQEIKEAQFLKPESAHKFGKALLLTVAYSASIGGLATLIGSVPNAVFAAIAASSLDRKVSFLQWMIFALPVTIILLVVLYFMMTKWLFKIEDADKISSDFAKKALHDLGPMSNEEKLTGMVFLFVSLLWIGGNLLPEALHLSDTVIAILGAVLLFLIPAKSKKGGLLIWDDMSKLPWGILLLFGGGLSLAAAFEDSGLTKWFGGMLGVVKPLPMILIVIVLTTAILFLTEVMSNTAVSNMLMPISIGFAAAISRDPFIIMGIVALSSTCAFMLPISTPPNAAVFSSDELEMKDMVRAGFILNIFAIIIISLFAYFWLPIAFGI